MSDRPPDYYAEIARRFRQGQDTLDIARALRLYEGTVANALNFALRMHPRIAEIAMEDKGQGHGR